MRSEAKKYIHSLANTITSASLHFDIWWVFKEKESRAKYVDILNEYLDFFKTSLQAHFLSVVVELYKIFETRKDTLNFPRLMKLIEDNDLLQSDVLDKFYEQSKSMKKIWRKIAILRSELFAHNNIDLSYQDVFKKAQITPNNIRDLIQSAKKLLNEMSQELGRNTYHFDLEATSDTIRILEDLKSLK